MPFEDDSDRKSDSNLEAFDWTFYQQMYPDLATAGIDTSEALFLHYRDFGRLEGRIGSSSQWLKSKGLLGDIFEDVEDWRTVLQRVQTKHPHTNLDALMTALLRADGPAYEYFEDPKRNSSIYAEIARTYLVQQRTSEAESFFKKSIRFNPYNSTSLEFLGNISIEYGRHEDAVRFYQLALDAGNNKEWLLLNLSKARLALGQLEQSYEIARICLEKHPAFSLVSDHLDKLAQALWEKTEADTAVAILCDQREKLVSRTRAYAETVYDTYLKYFGAGSPPKNIGSINADRVLIIADMVVPQCTRYRINQKIEQFEAAGIEVSTQNWMNIGDYLYDLAFYDVVIFYRVPALPKVLKAMAQVTAAGKLAIYEIDDLLFDPVYPPPIHTYGTLVDEHMYAGLMKGMALYNAAARCCRVGLASTQALSDKLAPLTQSGICMLHRNGLDKNNIFRLLDRSSKETVDIFYGSGTKAHNSDLTEIILPVMEDILQAHSNARFVVMGYAQLPDSFMQRFPEQIIHVPITDSVTSYYETLQWADINIAVLHSDTINDCKSELKWFEAACFGIPSVLSSTANYRDVIRDGIDGHLASGTQEWVTALTHLITNPQARSEMGKNAYDRVQAEYAPDILGAKLNASLADTISRLQAVEATGNGKPKVAIVNVFMRPQSIGGATRVVEDNLDSYSEHFGEDVDVVLFSSDVHARPAHRVSIHMDGAHRNYRTTILHREHMDWHPEDPEVYRLFSEFLAVEKPDLVHFHCVQRLTASVVDAARDAGIPYVVTVHDAWWISDHQFMVTPSGKVFPDGHPDPFASDVAAPGITQNASTKRRNHLKSLLLDAAAVTTVSRGYADIYKRNGIMDIKAIRNGISEGRDWSQKDTSGTPRVVIGHIGGMSAHKGYDLLRDTVSELKLDNIEILVADHSMEEGAVRRDRWGQVRVTFVGRVSQSKVADLYRRIDVLAAPSIWPESFGLVTREAAACGCWVIASDMGGIGEDVVDGETGFVIPPDAEALAEVLTKINEDPKRYKAVAPAQNVRYATEQAEKLMMLYDDVLSH